MITTHRQSGLGAMLALALVAGCPRPPASQPPAVEPAPTVSTAPEDAMTLVDYTCTRQELRDRDGTPPWLEGLERRHAAFAPGLPSVATWATPVGDARWAVGRGLWTHDGRGWQPVEAPPAERFLGATRALGSVWVLDDGGGVWRLDPGGWERAKTVEAGPPRGSVWERGDDGWARVPWSAGDAVALFGDDDALWVLGRDGVVHRFDGEAWETSAVPGFATVWHIGGNAGQLLVWGERMFRWRDGAWSVVPLPGLLRDVRFTDDRVVAGLEAGHWLEVGADDTFRCATNQGEVLERAVVVGREAWSAGELTLTVGSHRGEAALFVGRSGEAAPVVMLGHGPVVHGDATSGRVAWYDTMDPTVLTVLDATSDEAPTDLAVPEGLAGVLVAGETVWVATTAGIGRLGDGRVHLDVELGEVYRLIAGTADTVWFQDEDAALATWTDGGVREVQAERAWDVAVHDGRIAWRVAETVWSSPVGDPDPRVELRAFATRLRPQRDLVLSGVVRRAETTWVDSRGAPIERTVTTMDHRAVTWLQGGRFIADGMVLELPLERLGEPSSWVEPPAVDAPPPTPPPAPGLPQSPGSIESVVGHRGAVWLLDTSGWLWTWTGSSWVRGTDEKRYGQRLLTDGERLLLETRSDGRYALEDGRWAKTPGAVDPTEVIRGPASWRVVEGGVQQTEGGSERTDVLPLQEPVTRLAVDEGGVWAMSRSELAWFDGSVWTRVPTVPPERAVAVGGALHGRWGDVIVAVRPDGSLRATDASGIPHGSLASLDGALVVVSAHGVVPVPEGQPVDFGTLHLAAGQILDVWPDAGGVRAVVVPDRASPILVRSAEPARRVELFQAGVGHSDGKRLFWVGSGGLVQLVDLGTGTVERLEEPRLPARQGVRAVDGGWVLTGRRSVDVLLAGGEVRPLAEAIAPELMGVGAGRVWYTAALGEGPNDAREVRSVPVDGGPVVVHGAQLGERTDDARGQPSTLWPRPFAVGADRVAWWERDGDVTRLVSAAWDGSDRRDHGGHDARRSVVVLPEGVLRAVEADGAWAWHDDTGTARYTTPRAPWHFGYEDHRVVDGRWFVVSPWRVEEQVPRPVDGEE